MTRLRCLILGHKGKGLDHGHFTCVRCGKSVKVIRSSKGLGS